MIWLISSTHLTWVLVVPVGGVGCALVLCQRLGVESECRGGEFSRGQQWWWDHGGTGGGRKTEANQTMDNAPMVQLMGGEDHVSERLARIQIHQVHG